MKHEWTVTITPIDSPSSSRKHKGGLVVQITNGEVTHPVAQVGYARRNTANPDVPFDEAIQAEIKKAREAAEVLNEHEDNMGRIRAEIEERDEEARRREEEEERKMEQEIEKRRQAAIREARERTESILGRPSGMV